MMMIRRRARRKDLGVRARLLGVGTTAKSDLHKLDRGSKTNSWWGTLRQIAGVVGIGMIASGTLAALIAGGPLGHRWGGRDFLVVAAVCLIGSGLVLSMIGLGRTLRASLPMGRQCGAAFRSRKTLSTSGISGHARERTQDPNLRLGEAICLTARSCSSSCSNPGDVGG